MKQYSLLVVFILIASISSAQNNEAMLIPRTVYVGDRAVLILPLPGSAQDTEDIVLTAQTLNFQQENNVPQDINIDFHRIVLERRVSGSRLLIEFTAFMPGLLKLPDIEIGGMNFTDLTVTISSTINNRSAMELSGPASSLAMPGTALMLYGTLAAFVFLLLSVLWFVLKGRRYLQKWSAKWKRWKLFASMKKTEKRLHKLLLKGENKRVILDKLSDEFRKFLSFFTGNNCRAMTAGELEKLPHSAFPGKFFRCCDNLRFSGTDVSTEDVTQLLDDLQFFIGELEETKTKKVKQGEEKAA